jgi:hypothetical protein
VRGAALSEAAAAFLARGDLDQDALWSYAQTMTRLRRRSSPGGVGRPPLVPGTGGNTFPGSSRSLVTLLLPDTGAVNGIYVKPQNAVTCGDPWLMLDVQLAARFASLCTRGRQPRM